MCVLGFDLIHKIVPVIRTSWSCCEDFAWSHKKMINDKLNGTKHFIAGSAVIISRSYLLTHITDTKMYACLKIELINGNCIC